MVAIAPGEKTPHRTLPCEELDPPYDMELVFVQKITLVLRKINKNCCHHATIAALFDSNMHKIVYVG